ncbi:hypothetical protein M427DRAFT_33534 [Gonapodya prolifera JEL478]|uniref:SnoaL-like domain-containing protein n=1 Tax=Gonapodya prolifera (strain JEL478) TaxID=1344416 RepID=A0A139AAU3_GONPJ|nr:hypothetical protein M427DRAFT_33534 [Gonapodya prolifera JEL478]|eukprot:KXS13870.1 hypothetical protein M427DRAFT_33534 [Gonapodya prolifera JEL478]
MLSNLSPLQTSLIEKVKAFYAAIDKDDFAALEGMMAVDIVHRSGNGDVSRTSKVVIENRKKLADSRNRVKHDVTRCWFPAGADGVMVSGDITFDILSAKGDFRNIIIPFAASFNFNGVGDISEHLVFMDPSPILVARGINIVGDEDLRPTLENVASTMEAYESTYF